MAKMVAPQIKVESWFYLVPKPIDGFPETAYPRFYKVVERDEDSVGMREFSAMAERLETNGNKRICLSPIETRYHTFDKDISTYALEPSGVIKVESGTMQPYNRNKKIIVDVPIQRWKPKNPYLKDGVPPKRNTIFCPVVMKE